VAIKLLGDTSISAERNFTIQDKIVSQLSRESIDLLLEHFREDMNNADWDLVRELKPFFNI
jgi:translation initiation factor 5B